MARVLAISSYVAHGHVGLSAIVPALQYLGHEVIALPTVILSNHPGHAAYAGTEIEPDRLDAMLDALDSNGWLAGTHALLTGYLPTREHVQFAARAASRLSAQNSQATIYCDPVCGDDPKGLYVAASVASAIRDELLPLADMAMPNRFELEWLTGKSVTSTASAFEAACALPVRSVLATSISGPTGELVNLWATDGEGIICSVKKHDRTPNGTGDLLSALFIGHRLNGGLGTAHLGYAVAEVAAAVAASQGFNDLRLAGIAQTWSTTQGLPVEVFANG